MDLRNNGAGFEVLEYHIGLGPRDGDSKGTGYLVELYVTRSESRTQHFPCAPKYIAWQSILKQYTSKPLWSDDDLHKV
jgi:hypothetical protein